MAPRRRPWRASGWRAGQPPSVEGRGFRRSPGRTGSPSRRAAPPRAPGSAFERSGGTARARLRGRRSTHTAGSAHGGRARAGDRPRATGGRGGRPARIRHERPAAPPGAAAPSPARARACPPRPSASRRSPGCRGARNPPGSRRRTAPPPRSGSRGRRHRPPAPGSARRRARGRAPASGRCCRRRCRSIPRRRPCAASRACDAEHPERDPESWAGHSRPQSASRERGRSASAR